MFTTKHLKKKKEGKGVTNTNQKVHMPSHCTNMETSNPAFMFLVTQADIHESKKICTGFRNILCQVAFWQALYDCKA